MPLFVTVLTTLILVAQTGPAEAYLDPGTGSILLQMLLGGVAGGLVVIRLYWARIKGWFMPSTGKPGDGQGPDEG
jgi:hypothetical protein